MQFRGPAPKGMKAIGCWDFLFSAENLKWAQKEKNEILTFCIFTATKRGTKTFHYLSGSNLNGSGQISGS
jgi:hypothetical protein